MGNLKIWLVIGYERGILNFLGRARTYKYCYIMIEMARGGNDHLYVIVYNELDRHTVQREH